MIRKIVTAALLLAVIGSVVWSYLDYLKHEQMITDTIRLAKEQSRSDTKASFESQRRIEENSKRLALLQADLSRCQMAAEKARGDYLNLKQKSAPHKPDEYTLTRSVVDEAEKVLADDKAKCLKSFYAHWQRG